jgi:hypothetical protein
MKGPIDTSNVELEVMRKDGQVRVNAVAQEAGYMLSVCQGWLSSGELYVRSVSKFQISDKMNESAQGSLNQLRAARKFLHQARRRQTQSLFIISAGWPVELPRL